MLVISSGSVGLIQNSEGLSISFNTVHEMTRMTGVDFSDKFNVGYEPESNFFKDSTDDSITSDNIPNASYENLISNIAQYLIYQSDPYFDISVEEAYIIKDNELMTHLEALKCTAELNPMIGVDLTDTCYDARSIRQLIQEDLVNKQIGEVTLDQDEKDEAKAYQKLTEHFRKLTEAIVKGKTNIRKLDTVNEVKNFDVEVDVNWPTWNPPT